MLFTIDTTDTTETDTYVAKCWGCHNPYNQCECDDNED